MKIYILGVYYEDDKGTRFDEYYTSEQEFQECKKTFENLWGCSVIEKEWLEAELETPSWMKSKL